MGAPRIDSLNGIINPFDNADMRFIQRGAFTGTVSAYALDRYQLNTTLATSFTQNRAADGPSIADGLLSPIIHSHYLSPNATWAQTGALRAALIKSFEYGRFPWLLYRRCKFGFWYKTNKAGTYTIAHKTLGSSGSHYLKSFTPVADGNWHQFTYEIDPTLGLAISGLPTNLYDSCYEFQLVYDAGPDIQGIFSEEVWTAQTTISGTTLKAVAGQANFFDSASNEFQITGLRCLPLDYPGQEVDLWAGTSRPYIEDMVNCQRYFEKSYPIDTDPGSLTAFSTDWRTTYSSGNTNESFNFSVPKRTTAGTVAAYSRNSGASNFVFNEGTVSDVAADALVAGINSSRIRWNSVAGAFSWHWTVDIDY